jgi:hypothetical protein
MKTKIKNDAGNTYKQITIIDKNGKIDFDAKIYENSFKFLMEIEDNKIVKKVVETPYMRTTFTPSKK